VACVALAVVTTLPAVLEAHCERKGRRPPRHLRKGFTSVTGRES